MKQTAPFGPLRVTGRALQVAKAANFAPALRLPELRPSSPSRNMIT